MFSVQRLHYWPSKNNSELLNDAWNPKSRILKLGTKGLGLIVVKPGERSGCKNSNIQLEEMIKIRQIIMQEQETNLKKKKYRDPYPFDLSKVVLGAKFDDKVLHLSEVILDKVRNISCTMINGFSYEKLVLSSGVYFNDFSH